MIIYMQPKTGVKLRQSNAAFPESILETIKSIRKQHRMVKEEVDRIKGMR